MRSPAANGALAGCRVLELGGIVAGGFAGRLLADFGAQVVKVEAPEGDAVRALGERYRGKSLYAASLFRNKLLAAIDLRHPGGQEVARRLATRCDVLIENFRPGTLEKWGLGYHDLSRSNPGLVMVRVSGFGQHGPYSDRPGYGVIGEAVSGLRHIIGDPDRPPGRAAIPLTDYIAGLYGALGALVALRYRDETGKGQLVDTALYECAFSLMEPHVPAYDKLGKIAGRAGSRLPGSAPNNLYASRDGRWVHISAPDDALFERLAAAIGQPGLARDARFLGRQARGANADALDGIIAGWCGAHDLAEIEHALHSAKVPATRIFDMADIFSDPHYRAREMLIAVPDAELGSVTLAAPVPKLSASPAGIRHSGGRIGQDTRRVLAEFAGMTPPEVEQLVASGAVYCDQAAPASGEAAP